MIMDLFVKQDPLPGFDEVWHDAGNRLWLEKLSLFDKVDSNNALLLLEASWNQHYRIGIWVAWKNIWATS